MTNPIQNEGSTVASETTSEDEIWPMNEARARASPSAPDDEPPLWEKSLLNMGRSRLTRSESEIDREDELGD